MRASVRELPFVERGLCRMANPPATLEAEAEERKSPGSHVVHQAIVAEGVEELERSSSALAWSGLAGGLAMGLSLIAEAILQAHLPDAAWRPLVSKLGYSVGFLVVILGRQQLFTENTLTPILPLLERSTPVASLTNVARLWVTVLLANLIGALAIGIVIARTELLAPEVRAAVQEIARHAVEPGPGTILLRAIVAGWLIALLVWLLPAAETARIWVILIVTWLIGAGGFSHVIAGASEVFALVSAGGLAWTEALTHFLGPALLGNVVGGVGLVACLNHAQVTSGR
jgi:formate-nitrite transporter family protein